ncbi:MAG: L-2-amino-thiazoline-4-carboxylic acid hydrolase [Clostridia bacterium]
MSKIINEPKIKNAIVVKVREQLEHRAMWLALLAKEAEEKGVDPTTFGRDAIYKCGQFQGAKLSDGVKSFKQLKKNLFSKPAQWMFEMDIKECTDDKLSIDFHYCPLVKAWQKLGLPDDEIARLCDTAMCGDRGIASQFGGKLNLDKVIAKGDPICEIRFVKDENIK